jgi:hypothetical protein
VDRSWSPGKIGATNTLSLFWESVWCIKKNNITALRPGRPRFKSWVYHKAVMGLRKLFYLQTLIFKF